ncbi:uncharacterized protein Z519_05441 [Cladophialophora bantiana CBS 173.52]|uniref:Fungal N-terminal domain-containing protein n=1 Tax=Cladophialophora bantiana (strain ATCC 10958 / CBS 173.52 / CDC B-1940 / NIH 8579) TaxID=1442370 RepID=A0A0D2HTF8_CLAB1|nr:uncharacterized protein Z519_05441 [Cladophialophora bantiana CBS 173.52]KIW94125.1 hypothetical protein Z519_05441 [Cladophialophora bantiana CBS 173.52]
MIYKIIVELKENSDSVGDYQLMLIELEALDRTLKSVEQFLDKTGKFEDSLGPSNTKNRSFSSITQRLRWSTKYKDETRALRARLTPNLATITVLLMTQTVDTLSNAESDRFKLAQELKDKFSSQSCILTALRDSTCRIASGQDNLATQQSHVTTMATTQGQVLLSLESKVSELLKSNAAYDLHLSSETAILKDVQESCAPKNTRTQEGMAIATPPFKIRLKSSRQSHLFSDEFWMSSTMYWRVFRRCKISRH